MSKEETIKLQKELRKLPDDLIPLSCWLLEGTEGEKYLKEEIAKRRAEAFFKIARTTVL